MSIGTRLLPEFDHEMALTRKTLERVPAEHFEWQPHEKSMTLGGLTTHLANVASWGSLTINNESFDMAPPGEEPVRVEMVASVEEALERFDKNVSDMRVAIEGASDEEFLAPWTLLGGGEVVFTMPRIAVYRGMIMNHMIHHRAQVGVYLRMKDVPVPALYGPSADEDM